MPYLSKMDLLKLDCIDAAQGDGPIFYDDDDNEISYVTVIKWIVNDNWTKKELIEVFGISDEQLEAIRKAPSRKEFYSGSHSG